jgi:alkylresorcinol/alkylpyrone synthase
MIQTQPTAAVQTAPPQRPLSRVYLHGIGTSTPACALTQDEAVERMRVTCRDERTHRIIRRIGRQSGIEKRHLVALNWQQDDDGAALYRPATEQPHGPGMGARNACFDTAADDLVRRAVGKLPGTFAAQAETLVTVSCTHASSPGLERPIFAHTGVSPAAHRWNLGFMGCSAGLSALRLVHGLAPRQQRALVCTCELSSLHLQYSDAIDQITANLLFADGATALALAPEPSGVAVLNCRSVHLPAAAHQMTWFADDHGLRLELSRDLPDTLGAHLKPAVDDVLGAIGSTRDDVDNWLVHPGGPQILDAVEETLGLGPDALADSRGVLRDYGNMSSSTIFFILERLIARRGEGLSVAIAFGPGLTIELAVLELNREPAAAD